jgi:hypothetical protein
LWTHNAGSSQLTGHGWLLLDSGPTSYWAFKGTQPEFFSTLF